MSDGGHNPDVTPMAVAGPGAAALAARQAGPALLLASRLAARTTPLVIGAFGAGLVARYAVGGGVAELGLDIARRLAPAEGHATGAELALAAHGGLQRQAAVARWSPAAALPRHPTLPTGSRPGVDLVADTLAGADWGEPTAEWPATPTAPASRQPSPTGQPEPPPHSAPSSPASPFIGIAPTATPAAPLDQTGVGSPASPRAAGEAAILSALARAIPGAPVAQPPASGQAPSAARAQAAPPATASPPDAPRAQTLAPTAEGAPTRPTAPIARDAEPGIPDTTAAPVPAYATLPPLPTAATRATALRRPAPADPLARMGLASLPAGPEGAGAQGAPAASIAWQKFAWSRGPTIKDEGRRSDSARPSSFVLRLSSRTQHGLPDGTTSQPPSPASHAMLEAPPAGDPPVLETAAPPAGDAPFLETVAPPAADQPLLEATSEQQAGPAETRAPEPQPGPIARVSGEAPVSRAEPLPLAPAGPASRPMRRAAEPAGSAPSTAPEPAVDRYAIPVPQPLARPVAARSPAGVASVPPRRSLDPYAALTLRRYSAFSPAPQPALHAPTIARLPAAHPSAGLPSAELTGTPQEQASTFAPASLPVVAAGPLLRQVVAPQAETTPGSAWATADGPPVGGSWLPLAAPGVPLTLGRAGGGAAGPPLAARQAAPLLRLDWTGRPVGAPLRGALSRLAMPDLDERELAAPAPSLPGELGEPGLMGAEGPGGPGLLGPTLGMPQLGELGSPSALPLGGAAPARGAAPGASAAAALAQPADLELFQPQAPRQPAGQADSTGEAGGAPAEGGATAGERAPGGQNLEQLTQQIYDHLRRRLLIDSERRGRGF